MRRTTLVLVAAVLLAPLLAVLLTACGAGNPPAPATAPPESPAPAATTETAPAISGTLRLTMRGAVCEAQLGEHGDSVKLAITGPCAIMRDHEGKAQTYRYDDAGGVQVYVIVGELKGECGAAAQGLLVRGQQMKASALIQRGSYKCPKVGLDEKDYWMFAHK